MAKAAIQNPAFHDDEAAREALEAVRWPNGPFCPHCGNLDQEKIAKAQGKAPRRGLYYCATCNGQFTVTVGTVMERSKIPLSKWLFAMHLMGASKKGMSAHQLHRMLGITYKSAWFLCHRIREAMRETNPTPMGGSGKVVEVDETYVGGKEKNRHRSKRTGQGGAANKETVFALIERDGKVRSLHVQSVTSSNLRAVLREQLYPETALMTDGAGQYRHMHKDFEHEWVNHEAGEYVRGDVHTNTIEGYFSIMKRGINGVYHHVSAQHLKRYLAEFDFRYNARNIADDERAIEAMKGIEGKRLTYRPTDRNRG